MPSRIIREGWLESERIDKLDAPAERFFLRLCLRADDFGRFHGNPTLLKSSLYPLRDDIRSTDIPRWLAACEKAGLLRCYTVESKPFVEIARFEQRTRALSSKFPAPPPYDGQMPGTCQADAGHPRTESESDFGDGVGGEGATAEAVTAPRSDAVAIPLLLNTPDFIGPWEQWVVVRRKGKKPKSSWGEYFAKQLAWLEPYGVETATEIVAHSARNEYQGLFEPKGGQRRNPNQPLMR